MDNNNYQSSPKDDVVIGKTPMRYHNADFKRLADQCDYEYQICWDDQHAKKEVALLRLQLYNNQKRDPEAVGDTTMFTIFQTILASLYMDRLAVEFGAREEGDEETAENLNQMAKYDYDEMQKDQIDFDWDWDTVFFGWSIVLMTEFLRDTETNTFIPVPEVIDPTTFMCDPDAVAVNGNTLTGKNSMRFGGRPVKMTKQAMLDNPNFFEDIDWNEIKYCSDPNSLLNRAADARAEAQGRNP